MLYESAQRSMTECSSTQRRREESINNNQPFSSENKTGIERWNSFCQDVGIPGELRHQTLSNIVVVALVKSDATGETAGFSVQC